jgi:hypothetical protein
LITGRASVVIFKMLGDTASTETVFVLAHNRIFQHAGTNGAVQVVAYDCFKLLIRVSIFMKPLLSLGHVATFGGYQFLI